MKPSDDFKDRCLAAGIPEEYVYDAEERAAIRYYGNNRLPWLVCEREAIKETKARISGSKNL